MVPLSLSLDKVVIGASSFFAGVLTHPLQREIERQIDKRRRRRCLYGELASVYETVLKWNDTMNRDPQVLVPDLVIEHPYYDTLLADDPVLFESLPEAGALKHLYRTLSKELRKVTTADTQRTLLEESRTRLEKTILRKPFSKRLFYRVASQRAKFQMKSGELD